MEPTRGQFEIVEIRAAGAYGVVCAAKRSDDPLSRVVGLKVLHGTLVNSPQVLMRTRDEARLLSRLQHPNIVGVEELLSFDRRPVMVMEWVEGMSLRQILDRNRRGLPTPMILEVVRRTARALDDAYNGVASLNGRPMRIIHRDINPSNLLLSIHGEVKVVDFGVSRGEFVDRETTTISTILGAHGYMAPERMAGVTDAPPVDVYSLGVTFLECLARRLPVLPRIAEGHEVALQDQLDRIAVPDLPPVLAQGLKELLFQVCSFIPERRPTAAELVERIRALQSTAMFSADLSDFAKEVVTPLYNTRPRVPPKEHPAWSDVSFLEDPETQPDLSGTGVLSSTDPSLDDPEGKADRRVRRFLAQEGWAADKRSLKYLLALNPTWTPQPFLDVLDRFNAAWWKFWVRPVTDVELTLALEMLKHRPTETVQARAHGFLAHESPEVVHAAEGVVYQRDEEDEDIR